MIHDNNIQTEKNIYNEQKNYNNKRSNLFPTYSNNSKTYYFKF